MQTSFDKAMDFILSIEGGYVNDLNDPGGETNYGISKNKYPDIDIKGLTESEAREIYKKDYWDAFGCNDLPFPLDMCAFDSAVQHRPEVVRGMISRNTDYRDLILDRLDYYLEISRKNAALHKFFRGWMIRLIRLRRLCRGW